MTSTMAVMSTPEQQQKQHAFMAKEEEEVGSEHTGVVGSCDLVAAHKSVATKHSAITTPACSPSLDSFSSWASSPADGHALDGEGDARPHHHPHQRHCHPSNNTAVTSGTERSLVSAQRQQQVMGSNTPSAGGSQQTAWHSMGKERGCGAAAMAQRTSAYALPSAAAVVKQEEVEDRWAVVDEDGLFGFGGLGYGSHTAGIDYSSTGDDAHTYDSGDLGLMRGSYWLNNGPAATTIKSAATTTSPDTDDLLTSSTMPLSPLPLNTAASSTTINSTTSGAASTSASGFVVVPGGGYGGGKRRQCEPGSPLLSDQDFDRHDLVVIGGNRSPGLDSCASWPDMDINNNNSNNNDDDMDLGMSIFEDSPTKRAHIMAPFDATTTAMAQQSHATNATTTTTTTTKRNSNVGSSAVVAASAATNKASKRSTTAATAAKAAAAVKLEPTVATTEITEVAAELLPEEVRTKNAVLQKLGRRRTPEQLKALEAKVTSYVDSLPDEKTRNKLRNDLPTFDRWGSMSVTELRHAEYDLLCLILGSPPDENLTDIEEFLSLTSEDRRGRKAQLRSKKNRRLTKKRILELERQLDDAHARERHKDRQLALLQEKCDMLMKLASQHPDFAQLSILQ